MLSTPPAFILSQDQTLMLKVLIQPEYLAFLNQKQVPTGILIQVLLFLRFALLKAVRSSFDDLKFKIFQGYSLFSYQCSLLSYQRQLLYSIKAFSVCQELFLFIFVAVLCFISNSFILSKYFILVKNFFNIF